MNNFLFLSKDIYFRDPQKYRDIKIVIDAIQKMSVIKNYYESDLLDIEEVLSVLEMLPSNKGTSIRKKFAQLIESVIAYYTPPIAQTVPRPLDGGWKDIMVGNELNWRYYGYFVGALLNLAITREKDDVARTGKIIPHFEVRDKGTEYSVITFNYDRVLESFPESWQRNFAMPQTMGFRKPPSGGPGQVLLAKLHGGVGENNIVPPTWNKTVFRKTRVIWDEAYRALIEANHLRVIGYSLPVTDAYARYLFKAAAMDAKHLKTIDIITLDSDGVTKERYKQFIPFKRRRFAQADTLSYLKEYHDACTKHAGNIRQYDSLSFDRLEESHEAFMKEYPGD
jgi:hypothetical protein